jgi:hypothetical protein
MNRPEGGVGPAPRSRSVLAMGFAAAACATASAACSVLLDWSSYTAGEPREGGHGGGSDATVEVGPEASDSGEAGMIDAPALVHCGIDLQCSPPLPAVPNWVGPYALLTGPPGAVPGCDTSVYTQQAVFDGTRGLDAGAAQCTCSCSAPQNVGCNPPTVTFFSDTTCNSVPCSSAPLVGCVSIPPCAANVEISAQTPSASASCTPQASKVVPDASWSEEGRACAPNSAAAQGSCGTNQLCLPASTPFCIMYNGTSPDPQCPANGEYPFPRKYYQGITDERGCSACTCGAPPVTCSVPAGVSLAVGSFDTTCRIPTGNPYFVPVGCTAAKISPAAFALALEFEAGAEAGPCAPGPVGPSDGAAAPAMETTFCCTR